MLISAIKIGMLIYCDVGFTIDNYNYFTIKNVPTKVLYIDEDNKDIRLEFLFKDFKNKYIDTGDTKSIKKFYGKDILEYCFKESK